MDPFQVNLTHAIEKQISEIADEDLRNEVIEAFRRHDSSGRLSIEGSDYVFRIIGEEFRVPVAEVASGPGGVN